MKSKRGKLICRNWEIIIIKIWGFVVLLSRCLLLGSSHRIASRASGKLRNAGENKPRRFILCSRHESKKNNVIKRNYVVYKLFQKNYFVWLSWKGIWRWKINIYDGAGEVLFNYTRRLVRRRSSEAMRSKDLNLATFYHLTSISPIFHWLFLAESREMFIFTRVSFSRNGRSAARNVLDWIIFFLQRR